MSGGSLDYGYGRLDDTIKLLKERAKTPLHRAFIKHLEKVSDALYQTEWMLSGDTGEGDEIEAIRKVVSPEDEIKTVVDEAKKIMAELKDLLSVLI